MTVGFESMKYTVSEAEMRVDVCLAKSVAVNVTLSFLLSTEQHSALGELAMHSS